MYSQHMCGQTVLDHKVSAAKNALKEAARDHSRNLKTIHTEFISTLTAEVQLKVKLEDCYSSMKYAKREVFPFNVSSIEAVLAFIQKGDDPLATECIRSVIKVKRPGTN